MTRPTPTQVLEMNARKLVKEIWENELTRDNSELTISWEPQFMTVTRGNNSTQIYIGLFEKYFNAANKDISKQHREGIKTKLEQL